MTISIDPQGVKRLQERERRDQTNRDFDSVCHLNALIHATHVIQLAEAMRTQTEEFRLSGALLPWDAAMMAAATAYNIAPEAVESEG